MTGKPVHVKRSDWASDDRLWKGVLEGRDLGTGVTVLFYATEKTGVGPKWHVHPYDEIFIIRRGLQPGVANGEQGFAGADNENLVIGMDMPF
ncbi:MAG: hypothetical protein AAFW74_12970, partial [Pseudomonadota bacterium]